MNATHVYVNKGVFRHQEVSGLFRLAAPWKDTGKRQFVRVYADDSLRVLHTTVGETCSIFCSPDDLYYCNDRGEETELYTIIDGRQGGKWERMYRDSETEEEAMARIRQSFLALSLVTNACKRGDIRSAIVTGASGIGKSHEVERALLGTEYSSIEEAKTYEIIKGNITPIMLFQLLYKYSQPNCVLVFDDCDKVFDDELSANLLKGALDTGRKRTIQWLSSGTDLVASGTPARFSFEGSIMFLTNVDFDNLGDTRIASHLKSLKSRCLVLNLEVHSLNDMLLRVQQIVDDGLLSKYHFEKGEGAEIIDFIYTNVEHLNELSLRTVLKVADLRLAFPHNWKTLAAQTVMTKEAYFKLLYDQQCDIINTSIKAIPKVNTNDERSNV